MNTLGSLNDLNSNIDAYTNGLSNSWKGKAGEHLCNLAKEQIVPLIDEVTRKVKTLKDAMAMAAEVDELNRRIGDYYYYISRIDTKDMKHKGLIGYYMGLIDDCNKKIDQIRSSIAGLLS